MSKKLKALHAHLTSLNLVAAENIESFVDETKMVSSCRFVKNPTQQGLCVYDKHYSAAIYVTNFPDSVDVEILFSQIALWFAKYDRYRKDIQDPQTKIEVNDDYSADIEILIDFREPVFAIQDDDGDLEYNGIRYRLAGDAHKEQFEENYVTATGRPIPPK